MPKKLTTEEFIAKAISIHGNKYDYSKVVYVSCDSPVIIKCINCSTTFIQTPYLHTNRKHGCINCVPNKRLTKEDFINRSKQIFPNDEFLYDCVAFTNINTKVKLFCNKCDTYTWQTPKAHMRGCSCRNCGYNVKISLEVFIQRACEKHGDKYSYIKVKQIKNTVTKIPIICSVHGEFYQTPEHHMSGHGCDACSHSIGEMTIANVLTSFAIHYVREHTFSDCINKNKLPFDFYIPNTNTCIEYDGQQHYQSIEYFGGDTAYEKLKRRDSIKTKYCYDNGIQLIRIPYWDIDNTRVILEKELGI